MRRRRASSLSRPTVTRSELNALAHQKADDARVAARPSRVKPSKVMEQSARSPASLMPVTDTISAPAFSMSSINCVAVWRTSPAVRVPYLAVALGEAEVGLHLEQTVR